MELVEDIKAQGNSAFASADYDVALKKYLEAITHAKSSLPQSSGNSVDGSFSCFLRRSLQSQN